MSMEHKVFELELRGEILIVLPSSQVAELETTGCQIESDRILQFLRSRSIGAIVIDFHNATFFRKYLLVHMLRWWSELGRAAGVIRLCNVSEYSLTMLSEMQMRRLFPIHRTRLDAISCIRGTAESAGNPR